MVQDPQYINNVAIYEDEDPFTAQDYTDVPDQYAAETVGPHLPHLAVHVIKSG